MRLDFGIKNFWQEKMGLTGRIFIEAEEGYIVIEITARPFSMGSHYTGSIYIEDRLVPGALSADNAPMLGGDRREVER